MEIPEKLKDKKVKEEIWKKMKDDGRGKKAGYFQDLGDYGRIDFERLLIVINQRIERLIDKDHAIGHAYFIGKDNETIIDSFYKNIIPLLQEYFFGDYGKIGLVLGRGFVNKKSDDFIFADFDYENSYSERESYEIIDYRNPNLNYVLSLEEGDVTMTFKSAIKLLMN